MKVLESTSHICVYIYIIYIKRKNILYLMLLFHAMFNDLLVINSSVEVISFPMVKFSKHYYADFSNNIQSGFITWHI